MNCLEVSNMTVYYLHKEYDKEKFYEICRAIEVLYKDYKKEQLLVDVDDSLIQTYTNGDKEIIIDNCAESGMIKARANVDLSDFSYTFAIFKDGILIKK